MVAKRGRPTARHGSLRAIRRDADRQLEKIARETWTWAEQISEPTRLMTRDGVTRRILGVEEDAKSPRTVREGRQVIALLLQRRRPRGAKGDHTRHWAIWRMMNRLLGWSEFGASRKDVVFPYPTPHAAAVAVAQGFARAGLDSKLTANRVLKHYERHFQSR